MLNFKVLNFFLKMFKIRSLRFSTCFPQSEQSVQLAQKLATEIAAHAHNAVMLLLLLVIIILKLLKAFNDIELGILKLLKLADHPFDSFFTINSNMIVNT